MNCPTCVCNVECCKGHIFVFKPELTKLLKKVNVDFDNPPKGYSVEEHPFGGKKFSFYNIKRECCGFLGENNRCKIYKDRPEYCREFGESKDCMFLEFCNRIKENKTAFEKYMKEEM